MGTWQEPESVKGKNCVVKHLKTSCVWEAQKWNTTKEIYEKANQLAKAFNVFSKTNYPIHFTGIDVLKVTVGGDGNGPNLNEYVVVEDYIEGRFVKFCNNYGSFSEVTKTTYVSMPAFMHWSWIHTKGELIIADL